MSEQKSYPRFYMRIDTETLEWLKEYATRRGKPMAQILKEYLAELRRKDEAQRKREAAQ